VPEAVAVPAADPEAVVVPAAPDAADADPVAAAVVDPAAPDADPVVAAGGTAITGSPMPARASSALIVAEKPPAEPRDVPLSATFAPPLPPPPPSVSHAARPAIVAMARRRLTLDQRYQIWLTAAGADSAPGPPAKTRRTKKRATTRQSRRS
jgi:hypothetical protein